MNKYHFYPGCSMQRPARPYLDSLLAIRQDINIEGVAEKKSAGKASPVDLV